jgi:hypothetical protein
MTTRTYNDNDNSKETGIRKDEDGDPPRRGRRSAKRYLVGVRVRVWVVAASMAAFEKGRGKVVP